MANTDVRSWRHSDILSQSYTDSSVKSGANTDFSDEFPPLVHPVRELITFSIFTSGIIALVVWGGSKLL
jgi:hypothetical protein